MHRFLKSVFAPLSEREIIELMEEHQRVVGDDCFDPPFAPTEWKFPQHALPPDYLAFLRWSNGGYFEGLHRDLDPLFSTFDVRNYLLGYSVLHWMPETCPIGFDGGGTFYLLDMRRSSGTSTFPILMAHAGNLSFDEAAVIAPSFSSFIETALGHEAI